MPHAFVGRIIKLRWKVSSRAPPNLHVWLSNLPGLVSFTAMVHFFSTEKAAFLETYQELYRQCKENRTVSSVFMPEVITAYKKLWPEDDKPAVPYERKKTKSGRWSKKRPAGVEKPLREVSMSSSFVTHRS